MDKEKHVKLLRRELPKWPRHLVTGKPLTVEQAKEVIRRTDTFFGGWGGNNHDYNRWVRDAVGMPAHMFEFRREGTASRTRGPRGRRRHSSESGDPW